MTRAIKCGLRTTAWSVLLLGCLASCSDKTKNEDPGPTPPSPPPPVELKDQIEYDGNKPVDIRSAIYEVGKDKRYTFYLSPTEGITGTDGMTEANDFLRVTVAEPNGTIDTSADETFEIAYKDLSVKKATMEDVKSVSLKAHLLNETSRLNLYVEVEMKSGKRLLARYENQCNKAELPKLENQYELDGEAVTIGSVVKWENPKTGASTYYLYQESGITKPQPDNKGLTIHLPAGAGTEFDLSKVDHEQVSIRCGSFESGEGTTGTMTLEIKDQTIRIAIEARKENSLLRAAYSGSFVAGREEPSLLTIFDRFGKQLLSWEVTELQMRHDPNYQDSGSGEKFPAYVFYFVNANTADVGVDNTTNTPVFAVPDSHISCDIKNLKEEGDKIKWSFGFTNSNLSLSSYGYNNSWMKRCPEEAELRISKEGKEWTLAFTMTDAVLKFGNNPDGYQNLLTVEWKGPATKYTGSKPNDLKNEDY